MTLTDILPSMRRVIAEPFSPDAWPERTRPTVDDVVIGGVSLVRLASICETPCVHTGAALVPRSGGRVSTIDDSTAIVVTVSDVGRDGSGAIVVRVDARLDTVPVVLRELRLIGRISTAHDSAVVVRLGDEGTELAVTDLPGDVRVGDLLALPCPGDVTVGRLRRERGRS